VRVPFADIGPVKVPASLSDTQVLFLSDIFPTGYMAAENCDIEAGDTVAVFGCGPVGQFAIKSAFLLGAGRVIGIDRVSERLELARGSGADAIDFDREPLFDRLRDLTGGAGPDSCIDAVGLEAHATGSLGARYDDWKTRAFMATDRLNALRQAIQACGKGGVVSVPGVYGGFLDKVPIGAAFAKGLTLRMGQTHVHRYLSPLLAMIEAGRIDPSFVVSHEVPLEHAADAYRMFHDKQDGCTKVVLRPSAGR
jgi:threonine dehydrogenase-like Zn-dependent dehydrogenase